MSASIARQIVDWFHVPVKQSAELETLSPREEQILRLLTRGFLYKEIADQLQIGEGTVRTYIGRIYTKLHVHSRAEAMLKTFPGAFNR
jgi:DNA-binding NarL/FixJ family response regulator